MGQLEPQLGELAVTRSPVVAVIGASAAPEEHLEMARRVGVALAVARFHLLCGGGDGVMAAACRGFVTARSDETIKTIGLLPVDQENWANPYVDLPLPTGLGIARNAVIARMARGLIAVGGCSGTLSEIAYGWQMEKPIAALAHSGGWAAELAGQRIDERREDRIYAAQTAEDAVDYLQKVFEELAP